MFPGVPYACDLRSSDFAHSSVALAELDVVTPPLYGAILPGVTRASVLALHFRNYVITTLPRQRAPMIIRPVERVLTLSELVSASAVVTLREVFYIDTVAVVIPEVYISWQRARPGANAGTESEVLEMVIPPACGPGSFMQALWERPVNIQEGRMEWDVGGVPSV